MAYFRYLQLRHTAAAQFGLSNVSLQPTALEKLLCDRTHSKIISTTSLLHSKTTRLQSTETDWRADIPDLTEEVRQELLYKFPWSSR